MPKTVPSILVNADDLGLSPGVDRGILELAGEGVVHATSVMVDQPAAAAAVAQARGIPQLELGLHFDLSSGKPLTTVIGQILSRSLSREKLADELSRQIGRCRQLGFEPKHLNSHHHLHLLPPLFSVFLEAADREGIPYVRFQGKCRLFNASGRQRWLGLLTRFHRHRAGRDIYFHHPERELSEAERRRWSQASRPVEIVCHPGYVDDELRGKDPYTTGRELELASLRQLVRAL